MSPLVVVASAPGSCSVCGGARRVAAAAPGRAETRVPCPHCVALVPIVHLPARADTPRSTS